MELCSKDLTCSLTFLVTGEKKKKRHSLAAWAAQTWEAETRSLKRFKRKGKDMTRENEEEYLGEGRLSGECEKE